MTGTHADDNVEPDASNRFMPLRFKWVPRAVYAKLGNQLRREDAGLEHRLLLSRLAKVFPSSGSYRTGRAASLPRRRAQGTTPAMSTHPHFTEYLEEIER